MTRTVASYVRLATPSRTAMSDAERLVSDSMARARQAVDSPLVKQLITALAQPPLKSCPTVTPRATQTPLRVPDAALVNAVLMADSFAVPGQLPSAVVAVATTIGDWMTLPQQLVLEAVAVAQGFAVPLQKTTAAALERAGWDAEATLGRVLAAVAASRLLAFDDDAICQTLSLTTTQCAGLLAHNGTPAASIARGKAALDALEAAILVQAGFTAPEQAFEGRRSFFSIVLPDLDMGELITELPPIA